MPDAGEVLELRVMGRQAVERYVAGPREACISITDEAWDRADLSGDFAEVLRLSFWDAWDDGAAAVARMHGFPIFGQEHADAIAAFVMRHRGARRIVVHCGAGFSRSPAVALAIADALGLPRPGDFPDFNRMVRPAVHNALTARLLERAA